MSLKKSTFYLAGREITLRSDHLPLKKFLRKMTLNDTVNNWSTEIESLNINFVHISGKDNVSPDALSRLIDIDRDLVQQPELQYHEFEKYCFWNAPQGERIYITSENCWWRSWCVWNTNHMQQWHKFEIFSWITIGWWKICIFTGTGPENPGIVR